MPRPRSADQAARRFLALASRHETNECQSHVFSPSQAMTGKLFEVTIDGVRLPPGCAILQDAVTAISITLFDSVSGRFFGATFRVDSDALFSNALGVVAARQKPMWMWCPTDAVVAAFELLVDEGVGSGSEAVAGWATWPTGSIAAVRELDLLPGSAHLLYMDKELWPPLLAPSVVAGAVGGPPAAHPKVMLRFTEVPLGLQLPYLSSVLPPGVFVPLSALGGAAAAATQNSVPLLVSNPLKPFRLHLGTIRVFGDPADPTCANFFSQHVTGIEVVVCAHSGYKVLSTFVGTQLTFMESFTWLFDDAHVAEKLELRDVPNSPLTHLVLAIRVSTRSHPAFRTHGYAVMPLRATSDRDVVVEGLPVVSGPFSCEDPRMRSHATGNCYDVLPCRVSLKIRLYDTPIPPKRVEEVIEPTLRRGEKREVPLIGGEAVAAVPAQLSTTGPGDAAVATAPTGVSMQPPPPISPSAGPADRPSSLAPTVDRMGITLQDPQAYVPPLTAAPASANVSASSIPVAPLVQPASAAARDPNADIATYKLLCRILEDLDKVRVDQQRIASRLSGTSTGAFALGPRSPEGLHDSGSGTAAAASPFHLVDFAPRRSSISYATRCAMCEGMESLTHPVSGAPISDGMLSTEGHLPQSMFGLRVEGVTINLETETVCPQQMVAFLSFGSLPLQALAVMATQPVAEEDAWRTHRIVRTSGGANSSAEGKAGFVWYEPLSHAQDELVVAFKSHGTVYLHFYDAVTMYYQFTASIPVAHFARPLEAATSIKPIDVNLFMDYSYTEKSVPDGVFPVVQNIGQLHLSIVSVGVAGVHWKSSLRATSASVGSGNVGRIGGGCTTASSAKDRADDVVVAKRLALPDVTNALPASAGSVPAQVGKVALGEDAMSRVHRLRVQYVHDLLSQNGGAVPGVPSHHLQKRGEEAEMEYRLRFVEKKREETKARAIADVLKERRTRVVPLVAAIGRSEVCRVSFENPFPSTCAFVVSIPEAQRQVLSVAQESFATSFVVGPRGVVTIPLRLLVGPNNVPLGPQGSSAASATASTSAVTYEAFVRTVDRGETITRFELRVDVVPPVINRRYEIYGSPGTEVSRKLFSRVFSSSALPQNLVSSVEAPQKIAALCAHCTVSDPTTTASTSAVVDPITSSYASAWEEVVVRTLVPTTGAKSVLLNLYRDESGTQHIETWELTVFPCQVVNCTAVMFGRTTSIAIPIATDRVFFNDPQIVEVVSSLGSSGTPTTVRFKPKDVGTTQCLLHVHRGTHMEKVLLVLHVAYPAPTFSHVIELSAADAQLPVLRRFLFANRESTQRVFHVQHNYKHLVRVTPNNFALGPGDSQHLSLEVNGLRLQEGQTEGRWPLWIFINDENDGTVESYCLHLIVRLHRPFF